MTPDFPEGVALVTGGSGGIGSAVARVLAARGADVALTYRRNPAGADLALEAVAREGRRGSVHPLDLSDPASCVALSAELEQTYGRVHSVVHAAGSRISQPHVSTMDVAEWKRVLDADVNGFVHLIQAFLPRLRAKGGGSFTAVSSAGLDRFPPGDILSVGPKGAIEAIVRAVAREEGRHGIRANTVRVGVVDGGMFHDLLERQELDAKWVDAARKNIALRRFGSPDEIAEAIAFLASARASYVTGQRLGLDGGYSV